MRVSNPSPGTLSQSVGLGTDRCGRWKRLRQRSCFEAPELLPKKHPLGDAKNGSLPLPQFLYSFSVEITTTKKNKGSLWHGQTMQIAICMVWFGWFPPSLCRCNMSFYKKNMWKRGFQVNHWPCQVQELLPCISSNLVGPSADMPLLVPVKALEDHKVNNKFGWNAKVEIEITSSMNFKVHRILGKNCVL